MPSFPALLWRRPSLLLAQVALRCGRLVDETLASNGIDCREYAILALLRIADGPMAQETIGAHLHRDRTTIMRTVAGMERRSLVQRRRDLADRRVDIITITHRGRNTLHGAELDLEAAELEFFSRIPAAETRRALQALRGLL